MGKRVRVKPGKGQSILSFFAGIIFCLIGLFVVIPTFGLFGIFWTLLAIGITVMSGLNAFSKKGVISHEIIIDDNKESREDSLDKRYNTDTERRLGELKYLLDKELITREEYEEKRKDILNKI